MLNIDSEEEGVFTAGCAGGATVGVEIDLGRHQVCGEILDITFEGLTGGHSGTEINCQRANAIELLGRFLNRMFIYADYDLVNIYGGEKDNAIAKYAGCRICTSQPDKIKYFVQKAMSVFKSEFRTTDPDLKISVRTAGNGQVSAYDTASRDKTVHLLAALPYGVIKQSYNIEGLVQTSVNKGILKEENDVLTLTMSVRSSVGSEKLEIIDKIQAAAKLAGAKINISGEYPAWEYAPYSRLRDTMVEVYRDMFKKEPVVNTIHAGVECGIIAEKLTGLDCVSFGPDILDIHTTDERLSISSTRRTWDFIKRVLAEL
jgi:dipeptidase D